jgi:hypothetical protein
MIFDNILKLMLFICPVFYSMGFSGIFSSNQIMFRIFVCTLFLASLFSKQVRELPHSLNVFITVTFSLYGLNLYLHDFSVKIASAMIDQILIVIAFTLIVQYTISIKNCSKYIVYGLVCNIIVSIFQSIGYTPIYKTGGLFGLQSRFGPYLAIVMPLVFVIDKIYLRLLIIIGCLYVALIGNPECTVLLSLIVIVVWQLRLRFMKA